MVRPRAAGGLVVASETGVVLLDESDEATVLCEVFDDPAHPHERGQLRSAGPVLDRDDGLGRAR